MTPEYFQGMVKQKYTLLSIVIYISYEKYIYIIWLITALWVLRYPCVFTYSTPYGMVKQKYTLLSGSCDRTIRKCRVYIPVVHGS